MPWAPDYATETELADYVRIDDTADDVQIGLALSAASRAVDERCNRQFGQVAAPEQRHYIPVPNHRRGRYVVDIDDLMDDTDMTVQIDGNAVTEYTLEPVNAAAEGRPWRRLSISPSSTVQPSSFTEPVVAVTALWGWTAVPDTVKQATLLQASRFLFRRDAPAGIAGSPDQGSEVRLLARVDPDVAVMLSEYVRKAKKVG